jgi:hypothetical protein
MLDNHQVVGPFVFDQVAGGLRLRVQRVHGHDGPDEIQVRDRGRELGDLVGLGGDLPLGAHAPGGHIEQRQQVHLTAIRADRAADGLAVRSGLVQQTGQSGPAAALAARRCSRSCRVTAGRAPGGPAGSAAR